MNAHFAVIGKTIRIQRYKVLYKTVNTVFDDESGEMREEESTFEALFPTEPEANAFAEEKDGTVEALNYSLYEWLDGIEVADVPDVVEEAQKIYEMGGDGWLAKAKEEKQAENNAALAAYLAAHPITWTDGKRYGVSQQDQQEIALNLTQYQLYSSAGLPAKLEWHAVHEECREFTPEELGGLAMAISAYVYPLVRKNQAYKTAIYGATTAAELKEVVLTYEEAV